MKFIYVTNEKDKQLLINAGYSLISAIDNKRKCSTSPTLYVFENKSSLSNNKALFENVACIYSDKLMF